MVKKKKDPLYFALKKASSFTCSTSVRGLKLLVYEALSYECMRPPATIAGGLKLLAYAAVSY